MLAQFYTDIYNKINNQNDILADLGQKISQDLLRNSPTTEPLSIVQQYITQLVDRAAIARFSDTK
jgi:hypothetical protein